MSTPRKPVRPDPGSLSLEPSKRASSDFSNVGSGVSSTQRSDTAFGNVRSSASSTGQVIGEQTYTVQKGDTLSHIAKRHYGKASLWTRIFEANRGLLDDPDRIHPGQVLRLPRDNA